VCDDPEEKVQTNEGPCCHLI